MARNPGEMPFEKFLIAPSTPASSASLHAALGQHRLQGMHPSHTCAHMHQVGSGVAKRTLSAFQSCVWRQYAPSLILCTEVGDKKRTAALPRAAERPSQLPGCPPLPPGGTAGTADFQTGLCAGGMRFARSPDCPLQFLPRPQEGITSVCMPSPSLYHAPRYVMHEGGASPLHTISSSRWSSKRPCWIHSSRPCRVGRRAVRSSLITTAADARPATVIAIVAYDIAAPWPALPALGS